MRRVAPAGQAWCEEGRAHSSALRLPRRQHSGPVYHICVPVSLSALDLKIQHCHLVTMVAMVTSSDQRSLKSPGVWGAHDMAGWRPQFGPLPGRCSGWSWLCHAEWPAGSQVPWGVGIEAPGPLSLGRLMLHHYRGLPCCHSQCSREHQCYRETGEGSAAISITQGQKSS